MRVHFEIAQVAKKTAAYGTHLGGAAVGMIEATGFGLPLKSGGNGAQPCLGDGWKDQREQRPATPGATHFFRVIRREIPEFLGNRQGAGCAGDRHYLE
jgi:hypothetical protein